MTHNPEPAGRAFVPDLPDDEPEAPQRFRLTADQRNPDLGCARMWDTVILMSFATWAAFIWAVLL